MPAVVAAWKEDLSSQNPKAAEALASPDQYPNLFPELELGLKAEKWAAGQRARMAGLPASAFPDYEGITLINMIEKARELGEDGGEEAAGLPVSLLLCLAVL
jgi:coatomer subunit beta'